MVHVRATKFDATCHDESIEIFLKYVNAWENILLQTERLINILII